MAPAACRHALNLLCSEPLDRCARALFLQIAALIRRLLTIPEGDKVLVFSELPTVLRRTGESVGWGMLPPHPALWSLGPLPCRRSAVHSTHWLCAVAAFHSKQAAA